MGCAELIDLSAPAPPPAELPAMRREAARRWLNLEPDQCIEQFAGELGRLHRAVLESGVRGRMPLAEDESIRGEVLRRLDEDALSPGVIMAGMLFFYPHQWPGFWELDELPRWMIDSYLAFMMEMPEIIWRPGEADALVRFMEQWFGYVSEGVAANSESGPWREIGQRAMRAKFICSYFTKGNLRSLMTSRARIIEQSLTASGNELDHDFGPRGNQAKIRLGILAGHFNPTTETAAALPLFRHLDRERFEITLLPLISTGHAVERRIAESADRFVAPKPTMLEQIQAIRALDLDMLLICTNVTGATNVVAMAAAHRLARVQIASISSCVTTGMKHIDWRLTGTAVEPATGAQDHYTERLLAIEGTGHCYEYVMESAGLETEPLRRNEVGVEPGATIFVSGANGYKLIPELEETWARILAATPGSRLLLHPINPNWSLTFRADDLLSRTLSTMERHGVDRKRLLIFRPSRDRQEFLRRIAMGDVYLDSFPFSGATTLLDGLLVGLPPVVMEGRHFRSLMGAAFVREIGLPELVAADSEKYIEIAVRLGRDANERAGLKSKIAAAMAKRPGFLDGEDYGKKIGGALERAWEGYPSCG